MTLSDLHPFEGHPFKVLDDELMEQTVESIKQIGVVSPLIVRPDPEGGYEILSGHRRLHAAQLAGLETVPVIVKEMDDDAAIIFMVDSNLQRENILPSERAFSYKMKLEAMKHQGERADLQPETTSRQLGEKLQTSVAVMSEEMGESQRQIQRFIRLTNLIPEILDMVDEKKIAFNPAVELSYLKPSEQKEFLEAMDYAQASPSLSQAQRLKKLSQEGGCTLDAMCEVMNEIKKDELDHSGDFTGVDFKTVGEHELAETRTMDVLLVQPNAYPKKISVGTELEDLQAMVGGDIEVTYPFEDEVAIILNESGKINGLPLNRAIYTEDGDMQDIYAGDFLVVGLTEDDFGSLTSEQMQKFEEQFHQPQMFVRMGRSIMAIPVPDDMVKKMEEKAAKPQEKSKPAPDRDSL